MNINRFLFVFLLLPLKCLSQDSIKTFYPSGELRSVLLKKDSGIIYEKEYYQNGLVNAEGETYNNREKIFWLKSYYTDGKPLIFIDDSTEIYYDVDGSFVSNIPRKNFKRNGRGKFFVSRILSFEMDFKDGLLINHDYKTGKKESEEVYVKGIATGVITYFGQNGKKIKKITYDGVCPIKVQYFNSSQKIYKTVTLKIKFGPKKKDLGVVVEQTTAFT